MSMPSLCATGGKIGGPPPTKSGIRGMHMVTIVLRDHYYWMGGARGRAGRSMPARMHRAYPSLLEVLFWIAQVFP